MTSGKTRASRRGSLLAVALLLALPAAAAEWDVSRLLALLGAAPRGPLWFEEVKRVGVLEVPLEQSGTLEFRAPDYLRKHVRSPEEQVFEIDGERVRLVRPGQPVRELAVGEVPALRAFADGLHGLLDGNLALLERHYRLALAGGERDWTLTLWPRDPGVASHVTAIEFRGQGGRLAEMRVDENGGDSSALRIRESP